MRTVLRTVLSFPLAPYDADARTYITAVERADGQALETGVRQAIDAFVRGCKSDGIWEAIKASCILAGARTLSGALVPLKGTAPTNFNFVSGDYNRKTGLVGDGSTKYLDSNRANNADPQNSNHNAVYATTIASVNGAFMGSTGVIGTVGTNALLGGTADAVFSRSRCATGTAQAVIPTPGLIGHARSASGLYTVRRNGSNSSVAVASDGNEAVSVTIYRRADIETPTYGAHRLAFYSIGESLDLALLDARVTTLVNSIASAIDGVTDTDARAYINAVENADGQALEVGVAQAYSAFITGCKADGIWNAIKASCILAGARTLAGALVPLKGAAPTPFNFVSGDYNRKTGLVGDGNTKYLDSNRANNADPQNSHHASVYATAAASNQVYARYLESSGYGSADYTAILYAQPFTLTVCNNRSGTSINVTGGTGFLGHSRASAAGFVARGASVTSIFTSATSQTPGSTTSKIFRNATISADFANARLAFYSIGESLDLALLDARVTTLVNTLNSVIP